MIVIRFAFSALMIAGLCATAGAATEQRNDRFQEAKLQRALKGLHPGKPQRCVRSDRISEVRGFEGEILYVEGRSRLYRNRTVGNCSGLARGDILVTKTFGRQYCSGDIVQTRAPTGRFFTGSCSLGNFVPYTK